MIRKRIICALISASVFAGFACAAYAKESGDVRREAEFLQAVGVYAPPGYGDEVYEQAASRGEFISAVMHMAYPETVEGDVRGESFADAGEGNPYYKEILAAKNLGLVSGTAYNLFSPDENIALRHAVGVMKKVLGYETVDDSALMSRGLCDGVDMSQEDLSIGSMIKLLYNALEIDKMYYTGNDVYQVVKGNTLLSSNLKISDIKGIISENEYTALYNADGTGSKSIVSIGGVRYDCGSFDMNDYLGCGVKIYFKSFDDGSRPEIVYVRENNCNHVSFDSDDIIDFNNNTYTVEEENSRRRTYRIESDAAIICNGVAETGLDNIKPEYGSVELIDNDLDGRYDVVKILQYDIYYVDGIYSKDYMMYSGNKALQFDEETIVMYNGEQSGFSSIAPMSVVLVRESGNKSGKKLRIIEIGKERIDGALTGVDEDIAVINGNEYKINPKMSVMPPVGKEGTFYIDSRGRLAYFNEKVITAERYGYLMKAVNDEFESVMRIMTESSRMELMVLEDKVVLDGVRDSAKNVCNALSGVSGLIRYRLSNDGKINYVDTVNDGGYLTKIPYNGDAAVFLYRSLSGAFCEYKKANGNFVNGMLTYYIDGETKVFYKGSNLDDVKNFGAGSIADFINNSEYSVEGYDLKPNGVCGAIVIDSGGDGMKYIYRYNYPLYISSITQTVNDDNEECYIVKGIYANAECEYTILKEDFPNAAEMKSGDIVQFRANERNELVAINYVYRISGSVPDGFGTSDVFISEGDALRGSGGDAMLVIVGKSKKRYGNMIEIEYIRDGAPQTALIDISKGSVINFDGKRYTVSANKDIPVVSGNNMSVFVHVRNGSTSEVVLIER